MNEQRLRIPGVFGVLGAVMNIADTTITFAAIPTPIPTIVAGVTYLPIVLEADSASEEVVYLTAYTAGALTGTVARAQEGTTAVKHDPGKMWAHGPTTRDILASPLERPVPTAYDDEFDAAALDMGTWAWVNQGTTTAALDRSRLILTSPAHAGVDSVQGIVRALPANPWTMIAGPIYTLTDQGTGGRGGLLLRESGSGRLTTFGMTAGGGLEAFMWNSPTSFNASIFSKTLFNLVIWLRVRDDGTNLLFSYSLDGVAWRQIGSQGRAAWFTTTGANQIGFAANAVNGDLIQSVDMLRRAA